nr:cytochrome P450 [Melghirimyces algeriensis]
MNDKGANIVQQSLARWDIDLFSSAFKKHAYSIYKDLRANSPVHPVNIPLERKAWLVTKYDDVVAMLKDHRLTMDARSDCRTGPLPPFVEKKYLSTNMLSSDPPDHTRLRKLVQKGFTPRMVEGLRERIEKIAQTLLDQVQDRKQMDLIEDYAFPLPIIVICEMLGIPSEDRDQFREWSNTIVDTTNHPEKFQMFSQQVREFTQYLQEMIEQKRKYPEDDLISRLVQVESEGSHLTEAELSSMIFLLIVAGHETTVNLIGNGGLALLEHPDQMEMLKSAPDLMEQAVEELLRYYSPVELATNRWAKEEICLRDTVISKGDMVIASIASANRDEEHFECPDELDITRRENRHLAFGQGIHYCLGAPLARLEGQIALSNLIQRFPDLRLGVSADALRWRPSYLMRGLKTLPVLL